MTQAEQDKRIDYIEFPAPSIDDAKTFYSAVFGWKFTDYGPDYTSFKDGRLDGGFTTEGKVVEGGPLVVLYATDLESVKASVEQHGGKVSKDIFDFPGGRRFHFTDPGGNELAVWTDN